MQRTNFDFLVVGPGRGGTSLLAGLLDQHSSLTVDLEMASVAYLMGKQLGGSEANDFHARVSEFISACERRAQLFLNQIWGNKITTEQIHGLEDHNRADLHPRVDVIHAFFNEYLKDKKIIFILRDGRTCVNSKVRRTGQPLQTACERWLYSVKVLKFLRQRHRNNICVRFEELLSYPENTLTDVCDFLEVPYEAEMLKGTMNPKIPAEYRKDRLDTTKTIAIELPDHYLQLIRDDLEYCGYVPFRANTNHRASRATS